MIVSRVFRSFTHAVPAVLAAVTLTAGAAATAHAAPGIPALPGGVHRLQVVPGQNNAQATGSVIQGKSDSYSVATAPGQHVSVDVSSQNGNARVSVAPLVGPMVATEVPHADVVADGNDYQILVTSVDGSAAGYTLTVTFL